MDNPGEVNEDPQGSAWMIKVEMSEPGEKDGLMKVDDYKKLVDFFKSDVQKLEKMLKVKTHWF